VYVPDCPQPTRVLCFRAKNSVLLRVQPSFDRNVTILFDLTLVSTIPTCFYVLATTDELQNAWIVVRLADIVERAVRYPI
jgi:hypothetical protein